MRTSIAITVALILPVFAESSPAAPLTTLDMLRQCNGTEPQGAPELGVLACASYLQGMTDMHALASSQSQTPEGIFFCIPPQGLQGEEFLRVFVKWATTNLNRLHESARIGVLVSLATAFPCQW